MSKALKLKLVLVLQLLLCTQHGVDSASVVSHLPGFEGPLPFHLETGYIGVGEKEKVQLFYYFIKSENNPAEEPILIWLTGGPACTAFCGLAYENGPFTFKIDGYNGSLPSLISTSYSWSKVASIIFLDQPVGTGFSFSTSHLADKPSDTGEVKQTFEFLQKWLVEHPEFMSNPVYVAGDSYAGMLVPAIVEEISIGNENGYKPLINLKGYVLGNPVTEPDQDVSFRIPYAHGMGLISDELYKSLKRSCKGSYFNVDPSNIQCLEFMEDYHKCVSRIYEGSILLQFCDMDSQNPATPDHSDLSLQTSDCYMYRYLLATQWANDEDVHKALHVVKGSIEKWVRCDWDMAYDYEIKNSVPYHLRNSIRGSYRSLVFSGDHDLAIPFLGTQAWIRSLNYSVSDEWRPWFDNNQVIGYTQTYANNMTFATIKGGGHTAEFKPEESFIMFQRWIQGQPL